MRKGFMLVEVLLMLAIVAALSGALAAVFRTALWEIPHSLRLVQAHKSLISAVERIGRDISEARSIPPGSTGRETGKNRLLIELSGQTVFYEVQDDRVTRTVVNAGANGGAGEKTAWSIPYGRIRWVPLNTEAGRPALELKTWIEYRQSGEATKRFENTRLCFIGSLPASECANERP